MSSAQDAGASAEESGQAQRTAPPRPRKSFLVPIVIIVAIILVVAALAIAFVFVASRKDNGTPDDAFRDYLSAMLDSDLGAAYNETIYSLGGTTFEDWSYDYYTVPEGTEITINSIDQRGNESMTDEQRTHMWWMIGLIEDNLDVDVVDFCMLEYNLTITDSSGHSNSGDSEVACVKVDSRWYLIEPEDWLYDWAHPIGVQITRAVVTEGYKFVLTPTEEFSWSDMTIVLQGDLNNVSWEPESGNLTGLGVMTQNFTPGFFGNLLLYIHVTDLAGNGALNNGDYFTLVMRGGIPPGRDFTVTLYFEPSGEPLGSLRFTT